MGDTLQATNISINQQWKQIAYFYFNIACTFLVLNLHEKQIINE